MGTGGLACSGSHWGWATGTSWAVSAVALGVPGVPKSTHMPSAWILERGPLPTSEEMVSGSRLPHVRSLDGGLDHHGLSSPHPAGLGTSRKHAA